LRYTAFFQSVPVSKENNMVGALCCKPEGRRFDLNIPSSRTISLELSQHLTEINNQKIFLKSRAWPARKADNHTAV
jgi:hypothetical protein